MTTLEHVRTFEEHLAETKAMRRAREDEGKAQGRRERMDEEGDMGFSVEELVDDIGTKAGRVGARPMPDEVWLSGPNRFVKVYTKRARTFAATDALPVEMRLWFAALDRADYVGHAVFESGELEEILGRDDRAIRRGIAKGKAGGIFEEMTNSRHVWLVGVEDGSGYGQKLAKARFLEGDGYPASATGYAEAA